jgi:hypothetical protein
MPTRLRVGALKGDLHRVLFWARLAAVAKLSSARATSLCASSTCHTDVFLCCEGATVQAMTRYCHASAAATKTRPRTPRGFSSRPNFTMLQDPSLPMTFDSLDHDETRRGAGPVRATSQIPRKISVSLSPTPHAPQSLPITGTTFMQPYRQLSKVSTARRRKWRRTPATNTRQTMPLTYGTWGPHSLVFL